MECESELDSHSKPLTFGEYADELCSYYMALGVPEKEYWHGDPTHLKYYVKKHEIENENKNYEAWLQGLYIYDAIGIALHNAFRKKGEKAEKYRDRPIRITPLTEAEKQKNAEVERQKIIANLTSWGKAWERRENGESTD